MEQHGLPVVAELGRVARASGSGHDKLERAMQILFGAYGADDPDFAGLFLTGWARARHDKQFRLTLAWQREQIRLSIEEILSEGVRTRGFRGDLDAGAVAAVIVAAAEGCMLQAAAEGGSVTGDRVIRSLLALISARAGAGPVSGA
ncbi:MAG TPA: TetR family transcriptional regulator C-terminal domain-containing protein [Methylomirabilota bacterium]|nr:TetR family transcriptional regulator C-terminal domain-containing protein [Methylomirabilota bacterium]